MRTLLDTPDRAPNISYEALVDHRSLVDLIRNRSIEDLYKHPYKHPFSLALTDLIRVETVTVDGTVTQTRIPNTPNSGLLRILSPATDIDTLRCGFRTNYAYERGRLSNYNPEGANISDPTLEIRGTSAFLELYDFSKLHDQGYVTVDLIGFRIGQGGLEDISGEKSAHTFQGTAS